MTVTLQRLFPIHHLSALQSPPDRAVRGFVFAMSPYDGIEGYRYNSVNGQWPTGDGGWPSNRFGQADAGAEILADRCGAEVVWPCP